MYIQPSKKSGSKTHTHTHTHTHVATVEALARGTKRNGTSKAASFGGTRHATMNLENLEVYVMSMGVGASAFNAGLLLAIVSVMCCGCGCVRTATRCCHGVVLAACAATMMKMMVVKSTEIVAWGSIAHAPLRRQGCRRNGWTALPSPRATMYVSLVPE